MNTLYPIPHFLSTSFIPPPPSPALIFNIKLHLKSTAAPLFPISPKPLISSHLTQSVSPFSIPPSPPKGPFPNNHSYLPPLTSGVIFLSIMLLSLKIRKLCTHA